MENVDLNEFSELSDDFAVIDGILVNKKMKLGDTFTCLFCEKDNVLQVGCEAMIVHYQDGKKEIGHICKKCFNEFLQNTTLGREYGKKDQDE